MASEEEERDGSSTVYKMKLVQFMDRSVPIILQNDNGPCPLLAISNILLLRNNVSLNVDLMEISQRELMSLVAEWLLDANSNTENKDEEFVKNQQQNIGDAIQLLPRLATGIDVNVRFRDIHDFEYTSECAIFDLFHVGLVHGWLCDPQDEVTFKVIGSNSYNQLQEKLVALDKIEAEQASRNAAIEDEPTVDFAAATIAALGVPTPHMKIVSDEEFEAISQEAAIRARLNVPTPDEEEFEAMSQEEAIRARRKGDEEEEAELLQALRLSQTGNESDSIVEDRIPHEDLTSNVHVDKDGLESVEMENEIITMQPIDESVSSTDGLLMNLVVHTKKEDDSQVVAEEVLEQGFVFTATEPAKEVSKNVTDESELPSLRMWLKPVAAGEDISAKKSLGVIAEGSGSPSSVQSDSLSVRKSESASDTVGNEGNESIFALGEDVKKAVDPLDFDSREVGDQNLSASGSIGSSFEHIPSKDDKLSVGTSSGRLSEEVEDCASSVLTDDEPLYEGEQKLIEPGMPSIADKEPLYEGEGVSAELPGGQVSGYGNDRQESQELADENHGTTMTEGLIIRNFLSTTASQLTYHGLFSLQEGLKNNELYVFFRNNHFSTLFKYEGQIYLLATDQGYLAQPDLVWEKLTQVDGDTVFATGSFHQFHAEQSSGTWNERDIMERTTEFIIRTSQMPGASARDVGRYNSDLQIAIALQKEELAQQQQQEQQQQQQQARSQSSAPRPSQPSAKASTLGAGRLVTGPPRSSVPTPKQEKAKEKCTIM